MVSSKGLRMSFPDLNTPVCQVDKVMLVDDSKIDRLMCGRLLLNENFAKTIVEFSCAQSAAEYLEAGGGRDTTLLLLDVHMPRMNGLELLQSLSNYARSTFNGALAVMLSSPLAPPILSKFHETKLVHDFVEKPLRLNELRRTLIKRAAVN